MDISNCFILDVRTEQEFEEKSIGGSVNIPHRKILVVEYPGSLRLSLRKIPKDKKIIVFCSSGSRSTQAASVLERLGYDVLNMLTYEHAEDFLSSLSELGENEEA